MSGLRWFCNPFGAKRAFFQLIVFTVLCVFRGAVANAQPSSSATDLVGRNGQFTVKDKSGKVETVDTKQLNLRKELLPSASRAVIEDASSEETGKDGEAAKSSTAKPDATAPKAETPEEKAIRAADVETLRAMRKEGGAYFYTEDNKPVPFDEVDRRISTGEVEGLKAIGLHLQDWKPQTKSKTSDGGDSASVPAPPREPAPKEKKY